MEKFSKGIRPWDIPTLIEQGPTAFITQESLDRVAKACIKDNVLLASGTSVFSWSTWRDCHGDHYPDRPNPVLLFIKTSSELGYIYGFDDLWASRNR